MKNKTDFKLFYIKELRAFLRRKILKNNGATTGMTHHMRLKDFLCKNEGTRATIRLIRATWYVSIEDQGYKFLTVKSGNTYEEAIDRAVAEASDSLTETLSHLVLFPDILTKDDDGYFIMRTDKKVDLGALTIKELKNYATSNIKFWSYGKDHFVFHCGPVLHKKNDCNVYHRIVKVFKEAQTNPTKKEAIKQMEG